MDTRPDLDLHGVYEQAAKTQLALLEVSIAWWETVAAQGMTFTELCAHSLESLPTDPSAAADGWRRLGDFGISNGIEFGKLSAACCDLVLQALIESDGRSRRAARARQ